MKRLMNWIAYRRHVTRQGLGPTTGLTDCLATGLITGMVTGVILIAVLTLALPAFALDVPPLKARVNDYADMISPDVQRDLEQKLAQLEDADSTQIAILTIPSLEGDSLEDFSIRVAEAWKVGQKDKDNGAILVVSKADRKMRIEVGYGLEGRLTDILSGSIIDNVITPAFKAGDYDQGFEAGTQAMIDAVRGEYVAPAKPKGKSGRAGGFLFPLMLIIFFFVSVLPRMAAGGRRGSTGSSLLTGLLLGSMMSGHGRRGGGDGFGGFGGGGFGGGGGGFGGGGASGGW